MNSGSADVSMSGRFPESQMIYDPAVFVTHGGYQIVFITRDRCLAWVRTGGEVYSDDESGNIRSDRTVHKIFVEGGVLDRAGEYTVVFAKTVNRDPYFPSFEEKEEKTYVFRPVTKNDGYRLFMLCDTHSLEDEPVETAEFYGDSLDALVLNGDISDSSDSTDSLYRIHRIAERITHGSVPVVCARGNHDTRGEAALDYPLYVPTDDGRLYYSFRLGSIWGLVLDCGEDKDDGDEEYGGMANFDPYRAAQTRFLGRIAENAETEYAAPDVKYRIAVCHIPLEFYGKCGEYFTRHYGAWMSYLDSMKLDIMLCGHIHRPKFMPAGHECGTGSVGYATVTGGSGKERDLPDGNKAGDMNGTALEFSDGEIKVKFTDGSHAVLGEHTLKTRDR